GNAIDYIVALGEGHFQPAPGGLLGSVQRGQQRGQDCRERRRLGRESREGGEEEDVGRGRRGAELRRGTIARAVSLAKSGGERCWGVVRRSVKICEFFLRTGRGGLRSKQCSHGQRGRAGRGAGLRLS
ncbi:MAG: hypothetical protein ACKOFW_18155, partial [Planctomycetaceae bacterium]